MLWNYIKLKKFLQFFASEIELPSEQNSDEDFTEDSSEEEYAVEKILGKRKNKKNQVEYLIKWQGYDSSENSWESVKNLNCPDLVKEFEGKVLYLTLENVFFLDLCIFYFVSY